MSDFWTWGRGEIGVAEAPLRALVVYLAALAFVRLGHKRFLSKGTAFDLILAIMFGSIVSRAITGNSPLLPTLVAAASLVAIHYVLAWLAFHSDWFGTVVKGRSRLILDAGGIHEDQLARAHITRDDLLMSVRERGRLLDLEGVEEAHLERDGKISVIPKGKEPRVLEVEVAEGVQIVRIELG